MKRRRSSGGALVGTVAMPGDKSISHRALVLAALARGRSRVRRCNAGSDVGATAAVLRALGAEIALGETNREAEIEGFGERGPAEPDDVLDAGNSGTTIRTIAGICARGDGVSVLTGDASLRRRPMLRVVAPLRQMGASIDGRRHGDRAPLIIRGGRLEGIDLEMQVASAQVKTAVLLAGLGASGATTVIEPSPSRDHTERMLAAAGIDVVRSGATVTVTGGQEPAARDWDVPGDLSAAMFFIAGGAIVPSSDLRVTDVGLNPTRTGGLEVLRAMGADLEVEPGDDEGGEPTGTIRVRHSALRGLHVDGRAAPRLIDEVPVLAVAASQAQGETVFTGMSELRVKESDRIAAIVDGLVAVGGDAEALEDGLLVRGPVRLHGGEVDSRGDHRIAMAFAVAGLVADGKVRVGGWSCTETSFPEFLDVLAEAQTPGR